MKQKSFDKFCKQNLGDIVIRENGIPISKKIQNYETFWLMAPSFQSIEDFELLFENTDDCYSYKDNNEKEVTFNIDRKRIYELITKVQNPNLF